MNLWLLCRYHVGLVSDEQPQLFDFLLVTLMQAIVFPLVRIAYVAGVTP
jgi:hypothetical protein